MSTETLPDPVAELKDCHKALADLRLVEHSLERIAAHLYNMFGESPMYMKVEGLIDRVCKAGNTIDAYVSHDITRQLHRSQEATGNMMKALLAGTQMGREEAAKASENGRS